MTIQEVCERFHIPIEILREYEKRMLCGTTKNTAVYCYDEADVKRLSDIMTLCDAGFTADEAERYMRLTACGSKTAEERLKILRAKRDATLSDIHMRQSRLDRLDYLQFEIRRGIK